MQFLAFQIPIQNWFDFKVFKASQDNVRLWWKLVRANLNQLAMQTFPLASWQAKANIKSDPKSTQRTDNTTLSIESIKYEEYKIWGGYKFWYELHFKQSLASALPLLWIVYIQFTNYQLPNLLNFKQGLASASPLRGTSCQRPTSQTRSETFKPILKC